MAGAGAGAGAGPQGPEAQGGPEGAALEARLATLEAALAGEAAELEAERAALALAERSVRAREASVEEMEKDVAEARRVLDLHRKGRAARRDPDWRDWAGGYRRSCWPRSPGRSWRRPGRGLRRSSSRIWAGVTRKSRRRWQSASATATACS